MHFIAAADDLGTIRLAERYFQTRYTNELENTYLGDTQRLYDGSVRLEDAVAANVQSFLRSKPLIGHGLSVKVTVVTGKGTYFTRLFSIAKRRCRR